MKQKVKLNRRLVASFATIAMALSLVSPAAFPAFASAASTLQSRSMTMSSSVAGATGVSYDLQFTAQSAVAAGGGVVIDFCHDNPIIGLTCDTTAGDVPDASGATLGAVTYNSAAAATAGSITATATNLKWTAGTGYSAGDTVNITFNNITNPSNIANVTFYARLTTYKDATDLATYSAPNTVGAVADQGGLALSTANNVGITAYVQESLFFCVSGSATVPDSGCTGTSDPSLNIGEATTGTVKVLNSSFLSTGLDYAQIGTNAAHGAVVNLHSDAASCGGLIRPNDGPNCDIKAVTAQTIASNMIGSGKFGLILGPATATASGTASGGLTPDAKYDSAKYFLDYDTDNSNASGVTSTYGSPLFTTGGAPAQNYNMPITFGISPQALTPAGKYTVNLSLIATGTF